MYHTCIFCNRTLGANESIENLPVGRRLAFDVEKGRLWVVCTECRQWNLTPIEQRWEAIEECERHFRATERRFSTDNIGLARLDEGLDLVRIGRPQRPEYAAWRYGREFLQRRIAVSASIALHGFLIVWDSFVGLVWGGQQNRVVLRVRSAEASRLALCRADLNQVRLVRTDTPDGWGLEVPHRAGSALQRWWEDYAGPGQETALLTGPSALYAAAKILPQLNPFGARERQVRDAVGLIESAGHVERFLREASARPGWMPGRLGFDHDESIIKTMRLARRLALEMAAHEQTERRAFEGELEELEAAWREAEEIAAIADRLLVPEEIEDWIRRERERRE